MGYSFEQAKAKLQTYGQEHVLQYFEELSEEQKSELLTQIEETDFSVVDSYKHKDKLSIKGKITPLKAMELPEIDQNRDRFYQTGIKAIKDGKVGAVLLAGGMGTRLGSDDPKGMYNIGLTKDMFIFERIISNLMDVVKQSDTWIHLFIMTSDKNHDATVNFLHEKQFFGYQPDFVHFFKQEMAPAERYI